MGDIFRHRPVSRDELIGRVDPERGLVFETRFGPDKNIGRVDLQSGKVYRIQPIPTETHRRIIRKWVTILQAGHVF